MEAEIESTLQIFSGRKSIEHSVNEPVIQIRTYGCIGRCKTPVRVSSDLTECYDNFIAYFVVSVENLLFCFPQIVAGIVEDGLELSKRLPGDPAVCRRLEESLCQPELIAVFVKCGVGLRDRREQRPAIAIGQKTATRRSERNIGIFR